MINWASNRQVTIEGAVFGSQFVALKKGLEKLRKIRYKLGMMGIPLDGPTYDYGDNMFVTINENVWKS